MRFKKRHGRHYLFQKNYPKTFDANQGREKGRNIFNLEKLKIRVIQKI